MEKIVLDIARVSPENVRDLLESNHLPISDLTENVQLYAFAIGAEQAAVTGLEVFGEAALLRSVAVADAWKGKGIGQNIVAETEELARVQGLRELWLLTTTAEGFFGALGYEKVDAQTAPPLMQRTAQFSGLCPSSAACMKKYLWE